MIRTKHHVGAHSIHSAGRKANPAHASANALNHTLINLISVPEAKNCAEKIADGRREGWMIADEDDEMGGPKAIKSIFCDLPWSGLIWSNDNANPKSCWPDEQGSKPTFRKYGILCGKFGKMLRKTQNWQQIEAQLFQRDLHRPQPIPHSHINFIRTPPGVLFFNPKYPFVLRFPISPFSSVLNVSHFAYFLSYCIPIFEMNENALHTCSYIWPILVIFCPNLQFHFYICPLKLQQVHSPLDNEFLEQSRRRASIHCE